jgi:hypothetical protein
MLRDYSLQVKPSTQRRRRHEGSRFPPSAIEPRLFALLSRSTRTLIKFSMRFVAFNGFLSRALLQPLLVPRQ